MPDSATEQGAHFKGKLGIAVRASVKRLLHEHGIEREAFVASLPPDIRWFLTERYLATKWYPLPGAGQMMEALAEQIGQPPLDVSRRVGHDVAYATAGRVGRSIVGLFGTPKRVARYLGAMWGQLYDGGQIEGEYRDQVLRVRRSAWPAHHPLLCMTLLGSLECIAEHMHGVRPVAAQRSSCVGDGSSTCCFELRFESD